jgi:uncharacterized membrane protein YdfJ with MMPL/SSD domain
MQAGMDRLAGFLQRRRSVVLAAWIVALVAALSFAAKQTDHLTSGGFEVPGSQSQTVSENVHRFEGAQRDNLAVVLARRPGADAAAVRAEVDRVGRIAAALPHVELTQRAAVGAKRDARSASITVVPLAVEGDRDQAADMAVDFRDRLIADGAHAGVQPYLVGQQALWAGMQDLTKDDLESAERIGFPVVLIILLAVFGSLAAAALPLALGFGSVTITGAIIYFLSQATPMSVFVTNIASMIGIGVAVDYSLFVLARYREEVRAGLEPVEARRVALRTSGLAVTFSGITVILSLAGLYLVQSTTIRSMAMGAIIVVGISILAAVTLLPVLMGLLGRRAYARGRLAIVFGLLVRLARTRRRRPGSTRSTPRRGFWERWTAIVTARPWVSALATAAVLLALAVPALSLEFGNGALRQFPEDNATRVGAELAAQKSGPGAAGPIQAIAEFDSGRATDGANRPALASYVSRLRSDAEVARVMPPQPSRDGRAALVTVIPRHDPESRQAEALVERMRTDPGPLGGVADVQVGGATAFNSDFVNLVSGSMWKILLFVLVFSYLVLFLLLRSVLLPLKAVVMNLLSVAAAYGVLVMFFQYGWFDSLFGYHSLGYVNAMTPPFLLAIVFGLSMDYEVFLLSRIRERYDATGDTRRSVADGLRASAGTISSAALIMVAVFAVFAGTGTPSIKEIGVGMSVAIALDATLVRLILVPATMEIMGRWNWWLPKRVDRVLPHAGFESRSGGSEPALDLGR